MKISLRSYVFGSSLVLVLLIATISTHAQDPTPKETPPASTAKARSTDAKKNDPARRVPPYFAQIGLRPEQRDEIYKIRSKHIKKILELQQQVESLRTEMMTECERVLDGPQKAALDSRRKAAVAPPALTTQTNK